jgi:16S rRNA G527 N7-methylase RsmG
VLDSLRFRRALEVVAGVSPVPPVETMGELLELLVRWNRRFNLVSRASDPADLLADALVDAAALTRIVQAGDGEVADLGAGAGLVSTAALLLRPDLDLVLIEANAHKTGFLHRVSAMLAARGAGGFRVLEGRLEELEEGPRWRAAFSRATWTPDEGWRKARRLLKRGGAYIALAGPRSARPAGWNRERYADLFPDPKDYSSRVLLWRKK